MSSEEVGVVVFSMNTVGISFADVLEGFRLWLVLSTNRPSRMMLKMMMLVEMMLVGYKHHCDQKKRVTALYDH